MVWFRFSSPQGLMGFFSLLKSLTFSSFPFLHPFAMHFSWQTWSQTEPLIIKDYVVKPFPGMHNRFTNVPQNLHASFFKHPQKKIHWEQRNTNTWEKRWNPQKILVYCSINLLILPKVIKYFKETFSLVWVILFFFSPVMLSFLLHAERSGFFLIVA